MHTYELRSIDFMVRINLEDQGAVTRDGTKKSPAKSGPAGVTKLVEVSPWEHSQTRIGLYRRKAEKKFYWLDGRIAERNYQKWSDGETSKYDTEDFGRIIGDSNEENKIGNWSDTPRSSTEPLAICQWPI